LLRPHGLELMPPPSMQPSAPPPSAALSFSLSFLNTLCFLSMPAAASFGWATPAAR
jgi:hypothetical protein